MREKNVCAYSKLFSGLRADRLRGKSMPAANSTYPKGGASCFADTFVQAESSVLRMKFCGKSPALRVAANR